MTPLGAITVDTTSVAASEMSGITYVGPSPTAGMHRFLAVQDSGARLVTLDVQFSLSGAPLAATSVAALTLTQSLDFEGAAYTNPTRNSVFLAFENTPGVREYSLATGAPLQTVAVPSVFTNRIGNRGFEALARNPAGTLMWTGNEEALSVDGPLATTTTGTVVRLMQMNVAGNSVTAAQQYAYEVDPIHTVGISSQRRSGLADLVLLPDNTLLALERSFDASVTNPFYRSRVYEIDFDGATDVSVAPFASGLADDDGMYTPVDKSLLWSGQAGGGLGQNLEGLALGPRLDSGDWLLVGVVDNSNGEDLVSGNTLVAFLLTSNPDADFNGDSQISGMDFLAWQQGFGTTIGAAHSQGDADRDGDVDAADLAIWEGAFATLAVPAPQQAPEPATVVAAAMAAGWLVLRRRAGRGWVRLADYWKLRPNPL